MQKCFQIVGYPNWWGDRPRGSGRKTKHPTGRGTAGSGHRHGRGRPRANVMQTQSGQNGSASTVTEGDRTGLLNLTEEQWTVLLSMTNTKKNQSERLTGKTNIEWTIDSGASHHMTGSLDLLLDVHDDQPCALGLPNGDQTMATKEGTAKLGGCLHLTNVLYVPKLNYNLLSVGKLLDDTINSITFTKKLCVIQDPTSRMLIGVGKQRDGIYFLRGVTHVRANDVQ